MVVSTENNKKAKYLIMIAAMHAAFAGTSLKFERKQ